MDEVRRFAKNSSTTCGGPRSPAAREEDRQGRAYNRHTSAFAPASPSAPATQPQIS